MELRFERSGDGGEGASDGGQPVLCLTFGEAELDRVAVFRDDTGPVSAPTDFRNRCHVLAEQHAVLCRIGYVLGSHLTRVKLGRVSCARETRCCGRLVPNDSGVLDLRRSFAFVRLELLIPMISPASGAAG